MYQSLDKFCLSFRAELSQQHHLYLFSIFIHRFIILKYPERPDQIRFHNHIFIISQYEPFMTTRSLWSKFIINKIDFLISA